MYEMQMPRKNLREMEGEVKLLGNPGSPFSCRVEIALKLKGLNYEYIIEEDLSNKTPLLLNSNPIHKKIPVLFHNGNPIIDSTLILEYIDDTWKGDYQILPQDPYEKAVARFWVKFIEEKLLDALWKTVVVVGRGEEKVKEEAEELLKHLENELGDKNFFGGERIGFVDIVANFIAFWYRAIHDEMGMELLSQANFPKLWEWSEKFVNCDIVKETLPLKEEIFAKFPPPHLGEQLVAVIKSRLTLVSAVK